MSTLAPRMSLTALRALATQPFMGSRDKFFFGVNDHERCCYLRVAHLRRAVDQAKVLDALLDQLDVPVKPAVLRQLS